MAPAGQRVHRGFLAVSVSLVRWERRESQEMPGTQDLRDPQEFRDPKVKLVKRATQVHLVLLDRRARKVLLERMDPRGTWASWGCLEI